jgi:hypothetical protein
VKKNIANVDKISLKKMIGSRRNKEKKGSFSIPGTPFSEREEKRRNEQSFM